MLRLFKIVSRNKLFYIFAILILLMFPTTLYLQSDKDQNIIITTLGIDKESDTIRLSALAIIPQSGSDQSSNLETFEGEGETISEALSQISNNTGKKIGLAHCDCIAISASAMQDNITLYLDYFIRSANLTTNASLIGTDGKASDLLSATKSSNNLLDLSLRNIVQFKEERTLLDSVNIEKFYRQYFTESSTFYMPLLSTEDSSANNQSSSQNNSSSSNNNSSSDSQGSGSSEKKLIDKNKIAVITKGKFSRILDEDEQLIYGLLAKTSKNMTITLDNINDEAVTNSKETFEQVGKIVIPIYSFENNTPTVTYNVYLNLRIDEVTGENFSYSAIDGLHNFLSDTVKEKINTLVQDNLITTVSKMKENKSDILNLYTKFNAFKHQKWQNYLATLDNQDDYLAGIDIKINLKLFNVV
ncbi:MAG: hypothetical protein E7354_04050 [Clostridiales bacterium]|nr:hypothetical protein [Clostridiales bacterium]